RGGWGGGGWGGAGRRGWGNVPPAEFAGTRPFSATRAYDKLTVLVTVSLVCGIFGYVALPTGLAFVCVVGAFIASMVAWFNVRWSKFLAPTYAVLQGLALGTISSLYATVGHGIVPVAIVVTAGLFVGALLSYRTGLVRVTHRMASFALMGAIALAAVFVLSLLGLSLPGVNSFGTGGVIFGLIMLAIAMANLFTDFEYVRQSERLQVSSEAEWAAALAIMTALVLVYLSILRIAASMYGGRRN
ncbi:MAG: Bax inhibitor-1/YccA family protein, partial [Acidimicrobiaceae bacterium]|nr:Bax inhibitor-1/YccA family protein [Acidimicrobiaceae bacterium]